MEPEPLPPQQPLPPQDPLMQGIGYMPQQRMDLDPVMTKHLDSSEMLDRLKNMLLGLEYNDDEDEWKPALHIIGYDDDGKKIEVEEGPLMEPKDIRLTMSYLQMFLNSNTFLSQIDEERINDIMWDVTLKLGVLFYNLRHKLRPEARDMIWGMIEYPILLGLSRANRKITLDAVSKMQQTHEIIQQSPSGRPQQKEEFKIMGW